MLTLELSGLGRLGEALAEADGKQVYVFGGIPGETVVAEVLREHRGYVAAQVVEVVRPSPHRIEPACGYFGRCTGCQWQHVRYDRQLDMKREIVVDALDRIGGLGDIDVRPMLASPDQLEYRNHARFTISRPPRDREEAWRPGRLGYVHREIRRHVEVDRCLLMAPWINESLAALQGHVAETTQLSLRYGANTGDWLLQPTMRAAEVPLVSGQKHYTESLLGHTFQVSSPSFFQVNTKQAEQMAVMVIDALQLTGDETVVDAYAGVGTFAVLVSDTAAQVIAVEESAAALADARVNVEGLDNVELRQAKTEDVLMEICTPAASANVRVILDPPRAGCMPGTLAALIAAPPARIAYASCDPETLARDLKVLTDGPFRIESVQPIDMFPQTHHIECLTTLVLDPERQRRLTDRRSIVLASSSPRRQEILAALGIDFAIEIADVPEPPAEESDDPLELATARAMAKAREAATRHGAGTVVGADTVVALDGGVLGKPAGADEARSMLRALRGREHRVITAVALMDASTGESVDGHRSSRVLMREYSDEEIEAYVASGDPFDKAGAYAVQSTSFAPAANVRGCYLNVVGLPVCTLLKLASRFGIQLEIDRGRLPAGLHRCPECSKQVGGAA